MITSILTFLGGSAFRMIWGEASAYLNKKQDHAHELERLRLQGDLDKATHDRRMDVIRLEAEKQVEVIRVQGEQTVASLETEGWLEAVKATGRAIGVKWVDAWNAAIRPGLATWGVAMLTIEAIPVFAITLNEGTQGVIFAALGVFVADRTLGKRGK